MNKIKSAKKQSIDGVLFLPGVYKRDCKKIDDIFADRLLNDNTEYQRYDKIPISFTDLESHPKTTNLACWNCTRLFKGRPYFEPQAISPSGYKKITITTNGVFCSPQCVRRYINVYTKDLSERNNKISMLKIVCEIFTGYKFDEIYPAPAHTELIQYGGTLSSYDFQKKLHKLSNQFDKNYTDFSNINKDDIMKFIE
jgi:hypothetical protein